MNSFIPILALVAVVAAQSPDTIDWCSFNAENSLCRGKNHIACLPNNFPPSLSDTINPRPITLTQAMKDGITDAHNKYRNQISSAQHVSLNFPVAAKLSVMKWDDTLQYVAEKHAAYGTMQHDACRATPQYKYSGQNLFLGYSSGEITNQKYYMEWGVQSWFDEINVANASLVTKFEMNHLQAAGHFSVIVNDNNARLGCAAALVDYPMADGTKWNGLLLTCNYQYTNMLGSPTYIAGTPCQSCTCDTKYTSLCV